MLIARRAYYSRDLTYLFIAKANSIAIRFLGLGMSNETREG